MRLGNFCVSGDRAGVRNFGILVTDGRSDDFNAAWMEAMTNRESGITMLTVGIDVRQHS